MTMQELSLDDHQRLVAALLESLASASPDDTARRIETHISSVILHGDFAYKIKKPLDFGFLDFTTLDHRRHFCREELRLNRRLAPQIYLDVVPITGSTTDPVLRGDDKPIEYAVRMRRFSQDALLSRLAASRDLPIEIAEALAAQVADFHSRAARAPADSVFVAPEAVRFPVMENFEQISSLITDSASVAQLERLEQWSRETYARLHDRLAERGAAGWIRECHGDMHLGNMALIDDQVVIFDGIEFSERMRWTDVLGDVGFLAMDLHDRGLPAHANRFLNSWFEHTGDVTALPLLDFYRAYRAMVRAKIAALRLSQQLAADERAQVLREYHGYADLAERYTQRRQPLLCITHGLSGSGKSRLARRLVDRYGMLCLRSDIERKRLHGLAASARSGSGLEAGIYTAGATRATYDRLVDLAGAALDTGFPVVVDAAFLKQWQRRLFAELAARRGIPFLILDLDVPLPILQERVRRRSEQGTDASEAGLDVLERQLVSADPLADEEQGARRSVTTSAGEPDETLTALLRPGGGPARQGS